MKNPPNKDDFPTRSLARLGDFYAGQMEFKVPDKAIPEDVDLPAKKFGWDMTKDWLHNKWIIKPGEIGEGDDVSESYFDDATKTLIIAKSFNDPSMDIFKAHDPPIDKKELPYHSEIWSDVYEIHGFGTGEHLRYVLRNNIINDETTAILLTARNLLKPDAKDADTIEVNMDSDDIAERERRSLLLRDRKRRCRVSNVRR